MQMRSGVRLLHIAALLSLGLFLFPGCGDNAGCGGDFECPTGQRCVNTFCVDPSSDVAPVIDQGTPDPGTAPDTATDLGQPDPGTPDPGPEDMGAAPDLTADLTKPDLVSSVPADGASEVAVPFTVSATFTEPVKQGSFSTDNFRVQGPDGLKIEGTFTYNADSTVVTFTPDPAAKLFHAAPYRVILNTRIQDLAGNPLAEARTFTFFTAPPATEDYASLARDFAPIIHQEVTLGKDLPFDVPVAVDFDGDWDVTNNVASLQSAQTLAPTVYWSVVESKSHYFLTYTLYWPERFRGGTASQQAPNNSDGAHLMIRKSTMEVELLSTFFTVDATNAEFLGFGPAGSTLKELEQTFPPEQWYAPGTPFELFVNTRAQQACFWYSDGVGQFCRLSAATRGSIQQALLVPGDAAGTIKKENDAWVLPAEGTTYALVPLLGTLWPRRNEEPESKLWDGFMTYGSGLPSGRPGKDTRLPSTFKKSLPAALYSGRPPWAWRWLSAIGKGEQTGLPRGMSFMDPAWFDVWRHVTGRQESQVADTWNSADSTGFSLQYCYHPYLGIDVRGVDPECPAPAAAP